MHGMCAENKTNRVQTVLREEQARFPSQNQKFKITDRLELEIGREVWDEIQL